jgi:hypothetical protein
MGKNGKAKPRKRTAPRDLTARSAKPVTGGKAGKGQQEYMIVKLNDILIT